MSGSAIFFEIQRPSSRCAPSITAQILRNGVRLLRSFTPQPSARAYARVITVGGKFCFFALHSSENGLAVYSQILKIFCRLPKIFIFSYFVYRFA